VVGVAAIKIGLAGIDQAWELLGVPALIADENGVVILSSVPDWRYTALSPLSLDSKVEAAVSRLYNNRPIGNFPVAIDASSAPRARRSTAAPGSASPRGGPSWAAPTSSMAASSAAPAGAS
jgi:two-component system C4-dicarboxylate transport sensor histidine kinase DctB